MSMDEAQILRVVRELAGNYRDKLVGATSAMDAITVLVLTQPSQPSPEDEREEQAFRSRFRIGLGEVRFLDGTGEHVPLHDFLNDPRFSQNRPTDGHMHRDGQSWHPGWKGHDGYPVHRHFSDGRTEWEKPAQPPRDEDAPLTRRFP